MHGDNDGSAEDNTVALVVRSCKRDGSSAQGQQRDAWAACPIGHKKRQAQRLMAAAPVVLPLWDDKGDACRYSAISFR